MNNGTPYLKPPKNQNRRAALGRPAIKLLGWGVGEGALTSLRSTNPHPWFCLGPSDETIPTKALHHKTRTNHLIKTKNTQHLFLPIFYFFFLMLTLVSSQ